MRENAPVIMRLTKPIPPKSLSLDRVMAALILGCYRAAAAQLREHGADAVYVTEAELAAIREQETQLHRNERPPGNTRCLVCEKRPATRYARCADGSGWAVCDTCRIDEEVDPPAAPAASSSGTREECPRSGRHSWAAVVDDVRDPDKYLGIIRCVRCGEERPAKPIPSASSSGTGTEHAPDCPWHKDWHACTCGGLDRESAASRPAGGGA